LVTSGQLSNLRNFQARNRVQKVVMRLKAQKLSDDAIEELRGVFRKLDKSGTGLLQIGLCRDKIRRIPVLNEHLEEIMRVLWSLESGGEAPHTKFLDAMVERHHMLQKEACRAIFDVFDFDGGGTISREELKMALGLDGPSCNTFMAGIETVFGVKADDMEKKFQSQTEEYTFDEFFDIMQKQVC